MINPETGISPEEDDVLEEVVLRLQGIVCTEMLPPVLLIPR